MVSKLVSHQSGTTLYHHEMFSSVLSLSHVWLFVTSWIAACQASLSITNSQSSLRLASIESVMPYSHLILCHSLLLLPPIPPSIRVFSNELFKSLLLNEFMALILYMLTFFFSVCTEIHKFHSQVEVLPAGLETLIDKTLWNVLNLIWWVCWWQLTASLLLKII